MINPKVDAGNETILFVLPIVSIVKYGLRGRGGWDG
ncbi:hypothetical protein JOD24_000409 [Kroppenstedtia sanguinis]